MTTTNPISELETAIRDAIEAGLLDTHTALPGIVQKYNAATQLADIQLVVSRMQAEDGLTVTIPVLPDVPLIHPRSGTAIMHLPIAVGDSVLVLFCERNIDDWRRTGLPGDAPDDRRHHYSDPVALVGLYPDSESIALDQGDETGITIQCGNRKIVIKNNGQILLGKVGGTINEPFVLGTQEAALWGSVLDILIAGTLCLTTSPGNPTAPNPGVAAQLTALKLQYLTTAGTNILSQTIMGER